MRSTNRRNRESDPAVSFSIRSPVELAEVAYRGDLPPEQGAHSAFTTGFLLSDLIQRCSLFRMTPALMVISFIFLVGLMVVLAFRHAKKSRENFNQLASRLGFKPAPKKKFLGIVSSGPAAYGQIRGRVARLFTYTTGSGKSRTYWCALSVTPNEHADLTFQLTLQGLGSRIREILGSREIAVGDPAFDAKWFIRTNQPQFLQAALIPELRERFTRVLGDVGSTRRPSLKLESGSIIYSEKGDFANDDCCSRILALTDVMSDFGAVAEVFAHQFRSPR